MAEKTKTVKKVTKIPEASVTIEVEEKVDSETEVKEAENEIPEEETIKSDESVEEAVANAEKNSEENANDNSFGWKKVIIATLIAAIIGFLIVGGFLFLTKNVNLNFSTSEEAKSLELPTSAPTPTVNAVDKTAHEIKVLNGSGIAGEAANIQETLEQEGFKVSEIGNADNQNYTDTEISALEDVSEDFLNELEKTLEERGNVKIVDADSSQADEVIVIVGSKVTSDSATPTP